MDAEAYVDAVQAGERMCRVGLFRATGMEGTTDG
jgi:hypothetical protein